MFFRTHLQGIGKLDAWLGKPLLAFLSLFARRNPSFAGEPPAGSVPKRVICAQFTGLGSLVLTLPLLQALKDAGISVAFWSFGGQAELARLSGLVDEVWTVDPVSSRRFFGSLIRSWWQARKFKADAFLDLESSARLSAILCRVSGARTRIGFLSGDRNRDGSYTHLVSPSPIRHLAATYGKMAEPLGIPTPAIGERPKLPALPSLGRIRSILPQLSGRKRIVVNLHSTDMSWQRMWPEESWIALCDRLLEDRSVDLIFAGGNDDRDSVQALTARLKDPIRAYNIAGTPTLAELLKVLEEADLAVSVESGIMHLAAWAGTPLVAIYGPQTPLLTSPLSGSAIVLSASLPCSPCVGPGQVPVPGCRDHQCMKRISSERVFSACELILRSPRRKAA